MLVLESGRRAWSSGGIHDTLDVHKGTESITRETLVGGGSTRTQREPEALHRYCRLSCPGTSEEPQHFMHMPPFLQPLEPRVGVNQKRPACGMPREKREGCNLKTEIDTTLHLPPSAPPTEPIAEAKSSTQTASNISSEAAERGNGSSSATVTMPKSPTCLLPSKEGATGSSRNISSSTFEAKEFPGNCCSSRHSRPSEKPAAEPTCLIIQHQRSALSPTGCADSQEISVAQTSKAVRTNLEATDCSCLPYDSPVARLAAAFAASSLRLAAAAEEGLDSSPSQTGDGLRMQKRNPQAATPVESPGTLLANLTSKPAPKTHEKPPQPGVDNRGESPSATKVPETCKEAKCLRLSLDNLKGSSRQRHSHQQSWVHSSFSANMPRESIRGESRKQNQVGPTPVSTSPTTVSPKKYRSMHFSKVEFQSLVNNGTSVAAGGSNSGYSEIGRRRQEEVSPSPIAVKARTGDPPAFTRSLPSAKDTTHLRCSLSTARASLLQTELHDEISLKDDLSAGTSAQEEEQQFSSLLKHSMGLLQREASRCFASSQASVKQKLWSALQQERLLRLQQQQQHQSAAAAAAAELASLRATQVGDRTKTDKLLGICNKRKEEHDASCLLRTAWRGWQQLRVLTRRRRQVQQLSQQHKLLRLLMRTFLPWRAAAARCVAEQKQKKAHRVLQQEMQRLEQMHLEVRQQQQEQLLQVQQQLESEIKLRECLQHSLLGIIARGAVAAPAQGGSQTGTSSGPSTTVGGSTGILKGKQHKQNQKYQNKQRLPQHICSKPKSLAVVGLQSRLKERQQEKPHVQHKQDDFGQNSCIQLLLKALSSEKSPLTVPEACASSSVASKSSMGAATRRVKFLDEEAQQQQEQQQQLLLLASLLATSPSSGSFVKDSRHSEGPEKDPLSWARRISPSGLTSSASAPAVTCWGLINEAPTTVAAILNTHDPLRSNECSSLKVIPDGRNLTKEGSMGSSRTLAVSGHFEADDQPPKDMRWTSATACLSSL